MSLDGSCHTCKATETEEQMHIERNVKTLGFCKGLLLDIFPIGVKSHFDQNLVFHVSMVFQIPLHLITWDCFSR